MISRAAAIVIACILGLLVLAAMLFVVGETIDTGAEDCPPYYQCTPPGEWNARNCKCWSNK